MTTLPVVSVILLTGIGYTNDMISVLCLVRVMAAEQHPIILVANKADMVRSRKVKASLGKELATLYSIKYIETSSGQSKHITRTITSN